MAVKGEATVRSNKPSKNTIQLTTSKLSRKATGVEEAIKETTRRINSISGQNQGKQLMQILKQAQKDQKKRKSAEQLANNNQKQINIIKEGNREL